MPTPEQERLRTLRSYDILHSAQEKLFDDLTELASHIFSVPVARIAFVDGEQVWYKASKGLPARESLLPSETLCARAVRAGEPVLVYSDLRTSSEPEAVAALQHQIFFYAGATLCTLQGHCIGTLCLAGHEPRQLTPAEQEVLAELAKLVMQALDTRRQLLATAGPTAWQQLRRQTEEELHNQMALVRYLHARSNTHIPAPPDVLEALTKRLQDVAQVLQQA